MNKEKMNQIIDEAYHHYSLVAGISATLTSLTREEYIEKCKTDDIFSKGWGLKIEEKHLTNEERYNKWYLNSSETGQELTEPNDKLFDKFFDETTPKKQITITYKEEIIEIYE